MKNSFLMVMSFTVVFMVGCGKAKPSAEPVNAEALALRAAYQAGQPLDKILTQRVSGLYAKEKDSTKSFQRLVPQAKCVYDGDSTKLQQCFDQAVTRFLALKPLENNVQKFNLSAGNLGNKGGFSYRANATNIIADGVPATVTSSFNIADAISTPFNFSGTATGISASGPKFLFAALGTLLGATDGQSLAGGGIGVAFGYLDVTSLIVYYGAAGCAGGVVVSNGSPSGDGVCGVVPVAAVPLIP